MKNGGQNFHINRNLKVERKPAARLIRMMSIPILIGWLSFVVFITLQVPSLDKVGRENAIPMSPDGAPSVRAMKNMGQSFRESNSNNVAMIVLEGTDPLGAEAHRFYDDMIFRLREDPEHVQHIEDFWGDPLTEAGAQSADGKATYVQLNLAGSIGGALANESIDSVRKIVNTVAPPTGVTVFVTGAGALQSDLSQTGDSSTIKMTVLTFLVIIVMLLFFYRSFITVFIVLLLVGIQVSAASGMVSVLGRYHLIGFSTYAVNLLVMLSIAAGTDYVIFLIGRYQEARTTGASKEQAYYQMFSGTAHVILGTGSTIAGAMLCLSFTRMPYFQTLGVPCFIGLLTGVSVALTLGPAMITIGSRFGFFEPKRAMRIRAWRKVGAAIVRWPGPILTAALSMAILGLAALPGYETNYDDKEYIPSNIPANEGFAAADRHFSQARMKPEILLIEANRDMRNSADFLVIDKIAKAVYKLPGIARVQAITRPSGSPIKHATIAAMLGAQGRGLKQPMKLIRDRVDDMRRQADSISTTISILKNTLTNATELGALFNSAVLNINSIQGTVQEIQYDISELDDTLRTVRNYFYSEEHCFNIPICSVFRNAFDSLDSIDQTNEKMAAMIANIGQIDPLITEIITTVQKLLPVMESMQSMMLDTHSTISGLLDWMEETSRGASDIGKAFDAAKNDDSFYLPPDIFDNADFKRGMKSFISPDGKMVRMIISHRGDPATPEGLSHVEPIKQAAIEAIKGTPLEDANVELGGTAATFKDMSDGAKYDVIIAGISSMSLIFVIMLLITRSFIAPMVIVGTVLLSLGASFGLSVILWQYAIGLKLHWMVMPMTIIILLAVGSDYNLLLVSRLKEELSSGLKTGMIRSLGGTGSVVTSAGLVFALTMMSMAISDLTIISQIGTTIGLGLLFDTLVVRSFMTPAIAALLGRWFWWPMLVRTRPSELSKS